MIPKLPKSMGESPSAAPGSFDGFGHAVQQMAINTAWRNTKSNSTMHILCFGIPSNVPAPTAIGGIAHTSSVRHYCFFTSIFLPRPSAFLGIVTVKTPFWYFASILSASTPGGKVMDS